MEVLDKNLYVHKYFAHELTSEEERSYLLWLSESEEHASIHEQVEQILSQPAFRNDVVFDKDNAFKKHLALLQADGEIEVSKPTMEIVRESNVLQENITSASNTQSTRIIRLKWLSALAACMVMALGAWFLFGNEKINQIYNSIDSTSIASLEDGSKVFMNQGSKLEVYSFGKTRKVALKGEAFFDVERNIEQPFIISTGDAEVKVLGTKFTVSTIEKTVKVKEGKVEVTVDGKSRILTADQKLSYAGGAITDPVVAPFEDTKLWFNSELTFSNAPFDKVVEDISKFFNIKFELPQNRDWAGCTFTAGSLKNEKLDDILLILQLTYELQYSKINENTFKLSKVRCK